MTCTQCQVPELESSPSSQQNNVATGVVIHMCMPALCSMYRCNCVWKDAKNVLMDKTSDQFCGTDLPQLA